MGFAGEATKTVLLCILTFDVLLTLSLLAVLFAAMHVILVNRIVRTWMDTRGRGYTVTKHKIADRKLQIDALSWALIDFF